MTGKELQQLRKQTKHTLRSLSEKTGIDYTALSRYESGKRNIPEKTESKIKQALGLSTAKHDYYGHDLNIHFDYIRLTFFDTCPKIIMEKVLGISPNYFTYENRGFYSYSESFSCGSIKMLFGQSQKAKQLDDFRFSFLGDDELDEEENQVKENQKGYVEPLLKTNNPQGILLELSGSGVQELEEILQEKGFDLISWLNTVVSEDYFLANGYYSRVQSSRIDIAIDECFKGNLKDNFNLYELKAKKDDKEKQLIQTTLKTSSDMQSYWKDEPLGLTLYFGTSNGHFKVRMYEKAKERMKKENLELEEVLEKYGVVNRYELQLSEHYASFVLEELQCGASLGQLAIGLLLSKIEVFDEDERGNLVYCKKFYEVFGEFQKIKVNGKQNERTIEKTIHWIENQVIGSLAMSREVFGKKWLYDQLEYSMNKIEFSKKQQNIILSEKVRVENQENALFLYLDKKVKESEGKAT